MRDDLTHELLQRGRTALRLGVCVLLGSALAYYLLGCAIGMNARHDKRLLDLSDDRWELTECIYAAGITVTTVGYADVLGTDRCVTYVDDAGRRRWESATDAHGDADFDATTAVIETDWSPLTRLVTTLQTIVGMAFFLYVIAQVTSFFTEGGHDALLRERRTRRQLAKIRGHVVVCGYADVAHQAVEWLCEQGLSCAVIDNSPDVIRDLGRDLPHVAALLGDATDEDVLQAAGTGRARALLSLMPNDALNLVTVVTARAMSPTLRIVSRDLSLMPASRLTAAGADTVVALEHLVGLRAASELARPSVVALIDTILRQEDDLDFHFETLRATVTDGPAYLMDLGLREKTGLLAVAIRRGDDGSFEFNPAADATIHDGDELAVFGSRAEIAHAANALADGARSRSGDVPPVAHGPTDLPLAEPHPELRDGHYIVCGGGLVGASIARELHVSGRRVVVIDHAEARCSDLACDVPEGCIERGDARDPAVLQRAGIARARGLVTALPDDRDNLVMVVSALQDHPGMRVVAVARDVASRRRLETAGARVVPLDFIGGRRVAADILRPHAATFLDRMREGGVTTRIESVRVTADSSALGRSLIDLQIYENTGMRILALRHAGARRFDVTPPGDTVLREDTVLIGIGNPRQVAALGRLVGRRG